MRQLNAANENKPQFNRCCLCQVELSASAHTVEHVIPRWMQTKFNLWDERYVLENRTTIPFRQFRLPCCIECNGVHLSRLEEDFQRTIYRAEVPASDLPDNVILQWAAKTLYFIAYKENTLPADFRNPAAGNPKATVMLQGLADLIDVISDHGREQDFLSRATVYKLCADFRRGQPAGDSFDIVADAYARSIALRIRSRAFIVVFDGGINVGFHRAMKRQFADHALKPGEFRSIVADVFRAAMLVRSGGIRKLGGKVLEPANSNHEPDLFSPRRRA